MSSKIMGGKLLCVISEGFRQAFAKSILSRFFSIFLGMAVMYVASQSLQAAFAPPVYKRNATHLIQVGPFLGIDVIRTRTSWSDLHPGRVMFTYANVHGEKIPIILPTLTNNFLWPVLGRTEFVVLVSIPPGMPDGKWNVQSTFTDSSHWWNIFTGPRLEPTLPVAFQIKNNVLIGLPVIKLDQ